MVSNFKGPWRSYVAENGSLLPMFRENLWFSSSRVLWDFTQRRIVVSFWRFGTALKRGPIGCPKTSARNYHSTPRKIPKERRFQMYVNIPQSSKTASGALKSRRYWGSCPNSEKAGCELRCVTVKWSYGEVKWVTVKFLWIKVLCTLGWLYAAGI
jgi:hypothetical protein